MKKLFLSIVFLLSFLGLSHAQELYCNVQVNSRQVEGSDKQIFETLQSSLFEFLNNRVWTNYEFKVEERIECNMLLTISERPSSEQFKGNLTIAVNRPVFNSSYNTLIFNYVDNDIQFEYLMNQPFDFAENSYTSNITSIMAYYVYMILGLDFDTFALYGGTPFYEKAEAIVSAAQSSQYPGWKAFEGDKNRYWLTENLLNPAFKPLRNFLYEYHRKGLDVMYENPDQGRKSIIKALQNLKKVYDDRPGLFLIKLLMDAKRPELIQIFSEGSTSEKSQAVELMKKIDPSHSSEYDDLMNN
ncbi:MAG: DUF4835 family protein [Bacteroidales bacterium]|nr:DUF4835 family protein [Bacteroidales bacterium]MCF8388028.1 DUF4835 family protein [Bacteroidales bacterium]MCF8398119.1 DUF4835 family protein [Bacteroidales bacterium]